MISSIAATHLCSSTKTYNLIRLWQPSHLAICDC